MFLVTVGCLAMVILAVSVILFVVLYQKKILTQKSEIQQTVNRHQRELLEATITVAEKEREKIAKNIHDDIGTRLNVIKLHLAKISRNPADQRISENLIGESTALLNESIQTIRGIAQDLMPPALVKLGFEKGINEFCRQINASNELKIALTADLKGIRLPAQVELQLYRIVQELINNILKHAGAKNVAMAIRAEVSEIVVSIHHDGKGITTEAATKLAESEQGTGLKSIQSRVQLIGASIQYLALGNERSEISIEVPCSYEKAH